MIVDLLLALCFINEQSYLPFNHPTQPLSMLSLLLLSTLIERESYAIHLPKRGTMDRRHQNKKWEMGDPMMIKMSDDDGRRRRRRHYYNRLLLPRDGDDNAENDPRRLDSSQEDRIENRLSQIYHRRRRFFFEKHLKCTIALQNFGAS